MKTFVCWILALLLYCFPISFAQTGHEIEPGKILFKDGPRSPQAISPTAEDSIDVTYYGLDLQISASPDYLRGRVRIDARSLFDGLTSVTLDLVQAMQIDSVVIVGFGKTAFHHDSTSFTLTLDRTYNSNEVIRVDVFYQGVPGASGFGSFEFSSHASSIPWIWSLSEPYGAKDWWPNKDHPGDKADSADVTVTCDSLLTAGSNGVLVSRTLNGDGTATTHWSERYPIASYLISVAISNFSQFSNWFKYGPTDSMEVLNYVLPEDLPQAQASLPKVVDMLSIYSNLFGLYPFIKEKYGHAEFGRGGGMEHQTMTSLQGFNEIVIAHELSHQWFGDMITCRTWPHVWLNEGFASYCEALYTEKEYGAASYQNYMAGVLATALGASGSVYVGDTTNVNVLFDHARVYQKGSAVLHMLRHVLGDSIFFRAMYNYANDPTLKYRNASTEDFEQVCEETSGKNLQYFFSEWIYGVINPMYFYSWTTRPGDPDTIEVVLDQPAERPSPGFFTMPVDLKLVGSAWDTTVTVMNNAAHQTFTILASHLPDSIQFDPGNWILKTAALVPLGVDERENIPRRFFLNQNFPNPFNPSTRITYELLRNAGVRLSIDNVLGEEVLRPVSIKIQTAGIHSVDVEMSGFPSGMYFYRLTVEGEGTLVKKMLLLR